MANLKEIIAGKGIGNILFGMERDDVEKQLGSPNAIDDLVYENDDEIEVWHYDDEGLSLSFNEEDEWKLYTISVTNESYSFKNEFLIGKLMTDVRNRLIELGVDDLEIEDYSTEEDPNHVLLRSDELGINFWFENDILTEIQWNPRLDDEGCVIWAHDGS